MEATQVLDKIQQYGQSIADSSTRKITPTVGQYIPQGDVNFVVLPQIPEGAIACKTFTQLAPGTTRGSRHCIKQSDLLSVESFRLPSPNPLQGPILKLHKSITIEHPEHGDQVWPANTIIAVTYQRRYADEVKRIQD